MTIAAKDKYDVVVVGSGAAGQAAALTAQENGASVLLRETLVESLITFKPILPIAVKGLLIKSGLSRSQSKELLAPLFKLT
nr:FAD-binding protein [Lactobacillus delbrueckii]